MYSTGKVNIGILRMGVEVCGGGVDAAVTVILLGVLYVSIIIIIFVRSLVITMYVHLSICVFICILYLSNIVMLIIINLHLVRANAIAILSHSV